jgi:hypothetical protein
LVRVVKRQPIASLNLSSFCNWRFVIKKPAICSCTYYAALGGQRKAHLSALSNKSIFCLKNRCFLICDCVIKLKKISIVEKFYARKN